ncbi:sensor domain-containing phosphodiesterase [Motilimonas cestriensis]|uniref:Sensor domain-containing phosphodiesterase n=1 Tax=Motilimonas cestriensis TaxID=2742685 RepID=A0ABS8W6Q3_9GAMM|nr:sensor domain-containing phosphodiesterase [Motilimonas cestriensis]MCE2593955.1 sensor domain-containing phosphodiesterase [Motilimonas cestriensis]
MDDRNFKPSSEPKYFSPRSPIFNDSMSEPLEQLKHLFDYEPQQQLLQYSDVCQFGYGLLSQCVKVEQVYLVQFSGIGGGQILAHAQIGSPQLSHRIEQEIHFNQSNHSALEALNQLNISTPWRSISLLNNNLFLRPSLYLLISAERASPAIEQLSLHILKARLNALLANGQYQLISPSAYQDLTLQAVSNSAIDKLSEKLRLTLRAYLPDVENYVILLNDAEPNMFYASTKTLNAPLYLTLAELVIENGRARFLTPLNFAHLQHVHKHEQPHHTLKHSWFGAPILYDGKLLGVLAICSQSHTFGMQREIQNLVVYCAHLSALTLQRQLTQYSLQENLRFDRQIQSKIKQLSQSNRKLEQELKQYQSIREKLTYGAFHDPLTQLGNRALFIEKLTVAFKRVQRHYDETFAVIFIDLDKFKNINDYYGHHTGDQVLINSARLLEGCIRQNDVLARFGGDEFVILLDKIGEKEDILEISQRIVAAFESPMSLGHELLTCKCSLGITQVNNEYTSVEQIMEDADNAMYVAKHRKSHVSFHQDNGLNKDNAKLSQDLLDALSHGDIIPHYQPMIRLQDNSLMGFEVVARWSDRKHTLRKALDFIPFAEKSGLIIQLDLDILRQSCKQLYQWQQLALHPEHIRVAVNLSPKHLLSTESVNRLLEIIHQAKVSPKNLVFEFSEKEFVRQNQSSFEALDKLRAAGILIGMDDFGTGFSSLNALFDYPIDFIKVDRSFTSRMLSSKKDLSLMRAVRDLSNDLGFQVIIEGIETIQQHKKLVEIGCEYGQGYYIAKPMKPGDVEHLFEA